MSGWVGWWSGPTYTFCLSSCFSIYNYSLPSITPYHLLFFQCSNHIWPLLYHYELSCLWAFACAVPSARCLFSASGLDSNLTSPLVHLDNTHCYSLDYPPEVHALQAWFTCGSVEVMESLRVAAWYKVFSSHGTLLLEGINGGLRRVGDYRVRSASILGPFSTWSFPSPLLHHAARGPASEAEQMRSPGLGLWGSNVWNK